MNKTFKFINWLRGRNFISCTPQFINETGMNSINSHLEILYNNFENEFQNLHLKEILLNDKFVYDSNGVTKPKQYQIGIDTFARAESNLTKEEIIAICKFNIDKYCWRKKDQDKDDFKKIIDYANWAIKNL